jgi:hypothetical protein
LSKALDACFKIEKKKTSFLHARSQKKELASSLQAGLKKKQKKSEKTFPVFISFSFEEKRKMVK